jgi:hypothetical protein
MYPAQGLIDGLFTVADLPDQIAFSSDGGDVLNKIDPPVPAFGAEGITMYYGLAGEGVGIEDATGGWVYFIDGGINPDVILNPACLFSDSNDPQTPPFDVFEDAYTVQIVSGESAGTYIVTRRSLCVWSEALDGDDPSGARIIAGSLPNGTMLWEVKDGGGAYLKTGNLNSPVGNYGIPTTGAIVSE